MVDGRREIIEASRKRDRMLREHDQDGMPLTLSILS
jgi:hypothetical protein